MCTQTNIMFCLLVKEGRGGMGWGWGWGGVGGVGWGGVGWGDLRRRAGVTTGGV